MKTKNKQTKPKRKKDASSTFPHYWICGSCAKERGGKWPNGHIATAIKDSCKYCDGPIEIIYPYCDWNWPKNKELDLKSKLMRD